MLRQYSNNKNTFFFFGKKYSFLLTDIVPLFDLKDCIIKTIKQTQY